MRSDGIKSFVNCILAKLKSSNFAIVLAKVVLPVPGTSSISKCPRDKKQESANLVSWPLPRMDFSALDKKSLIEEFIIHPIYSDLRDMLIEIMNISI
jgi:hypothetical protein